MVSAYETAGAAAISCLTNQTYFGGTLEDLKAMSLSGDPCAPKDFVVDRRQLLIGGGATRFVDRRMPPRPMAG